MWSQHLAVRHNVAVRLVVAPRVHPTRLRRRWMSVLLRLHPHSGVPHTTKLCVVPWPLRVFPIHDPTTGQLWGQAGWWAIEPGPPCTGK